MAKILDPSHKAGLLEAMRILRDRWEYWDAAHVCGDLDCSKQRQEAWQCYDRVRKAAGEPPWEPIPSKARGER